MTCKCFKGFSKFVDQIKELKVLIVFGRGIKSRVVPVF